MTRLRWCRRVETFDPGGGFTDAFTIEVVNMSGDEQHGGRDRWVLLESIADGVLVVDHDGSIVYANGRIERLLGYRPSELFGRSVDELLDSDARAAHARQRRDYCDAPRVREMGGGLDIWAVCKDGSHVSLDVHLGPLGATGLVVASLRRRSPDPALLVAVDELVIREREARAMLDLVVQRLFGISMSIEAQRPGASDQLAERSNELIDETIEMIRTAVLERSGYDPKLAKAQQQLLDGSPGGE
jgi:PAS domain S-box-containing protein